jgi:membrane protein required for colicin V production
MNTFDIILAIILVFGLVTGYFQGLIVEVASLASLIIGIYISMHFSYFLANILTDVGDLKPSVVQMVSFAATFFLVVLGIGLAGKFFTKLAEKIHLGFVNNILGAVFGLLKMAIIISIVLLVFDALNSKIPFVSKEKMDNSALYEPLKNLGTKVFPKLIQVRGVIEEKAEF